MQDKLQEHLLNRRKAVGTCNLFRNTAVALAFYK